MFDFFKKRFISKAPEPEPIQPRIQQKQLTEKNRDAIQLATQRSEKQAALAQAAQCNGQENAAVAFILTSDFADARLQAALHIHSQDALMQVYQAMRNTDRRVTKLVQEKLAALQKQQKMNAAVQACLLQGQQLLKSSPLMVNQVAEWDKQRLALGEHGLSLLPTKEELENRLHAQLDLQRQVMQISGKLRSMVEMSLSLEQAKAQLADCHHNWQEIQSNALFTTVPKNQSQQLTNDLVRAHSHIEQLEQIILTPVISDIAKSDEKIQLESEPESKHQAKQKQEVIATPSLDVNAVLAGLEQALDAGSLQQALDIDKSLRKAAIPMQGEIVQQLAVLRAELNRLLDWAKWGGNVSREELINVATGLVENKLTAQEIAKQIGGLRARWKELDRTSGTAVPALWERFDAACGRAYQIADTHFKQQAQQRLINLDLAKAQLASMDEVIAAMQNQLPDWKEHQLYLIKMKLAWRKLGPIDRKLRASLDTEFNQRIAALSQPLNAARAVAISARHQLIASVTALAEKDTVTARDAIEKVQQAQQSWQQQALHLPLEQKDEKKLWRQFRAACDAVFAQRKAKVDEQHQRRNQLNIARQACCEAVEKSLEKPSVEIAQALRNAQQEWRNLSQQLVGKYKPDELDARFAAALNQLEKRNAELLVADKKAALINLRGKITLCRKIEAEGVEQNAAWQTEWDSMATNLLPLELNKLLTQRLNNAVANRVNRDANAAQVEEHLLCIELLRGLPSPPELAQQRLQLQVTNLQSALKSRDGSSSNYLTNFSTLCALPVQLDAQQERRFQDILDDYRL